MDTGNRQGKVVRSDISRVALLALLAAGASSCGRSPLGTSLEHEPASVVLELKEAPADILCITVTIAGSREEKRRLDVPADGPASFVLRRLPIGLVVFSAEAHPTACNVLSDSAEPTWTGGPVSAHLQAGPNGTVTINMVPAVRAGVSIKFADGGAGPTCAAAGYACASSSDCCAGSSCVFGAEGTGRCQPIAVADGDAGVAPEAPTPDTTPDTGPPAVSVRLEGGAYYVVYPVGDTAACNRADGEIYTATVAPGDPPRCIPLQLGGLVPVQVRQLQVCTPGGSCAPCTTGSCLPAGCFDPLPPPSPIFGCGPNLAPPTGPDPITYLLFQDLQPPGSPARPPAQEGLPMVLTAPATGDAGTGESEVVIRPPVGHGPIVFGNLLVRPGAGGDSCGATSMCGVLPLWGVSSFNFSSWSVFQNTGSGLTFWSF